MPLLWCFIASACLLTYMRLCLCVLTFSQKGHTILVFATRTLLFLYVHFGFISLSFMLLCPQEEDEMQTKLVLWMIIFCMWCSGFLTTWNVMIAFPSLSGLWLSKACLDPRKTLSSTHGCLVSSIDQLKIKKKKKKKKIIMIYSSLFIFMSANVVLNLRSVIQETV